MTTKRLALLLAVLLTGLGAVFFLPKQLASQPLGINPQLPEQIGAWTGTEMKVSDEERRVLGAETEIFRKRYLTQRGDEVQVSIVLAGQDMSTSIHRPERCLPAQGWTIINKRTADVDVPEFGLLEPTRLHSLHGIKRPSQKPLNLYNVSYYWFVGHTNVTGSHWQRTWIDIKDRLTHGYNQRWAYITVSSTVITKEAEADALIKTFIEELVPTLHLNSVKGS